MVVSSQMITILKRTVYKVELPYVRWSIAVQNVGFLVLRCANMDGNQLYLNDENPHHQRE
jgi:hypothetical protein